MKKIGFSILFFLGLGPLMAQEVKITVVGAGLAGLTTAYRLEKLTGSPVDVYEARGRAGGRVYTIHFGNSYEEMGGKSLSDGGKAKNIKALITEMGLQIEAHQVSLTNRKYYYQGDVDLYYSAYLHGPRPTAEMHAQMMGWASTAKSMDEVLNRFFSNHPVLRYLTEARMRNFEGNDSKDLSLAYLDGFWAYYLKNYDSAYQKQMPHYTMEYVKGGNYLLIEKLAGALQKPIYFNAPLRKIAKTPQGQLRLHFDNQPEVITDYLVLALPCSTLKNVDIEEGLFPLDQKEAIHALQYGTNGKILLPVAHMPPDVSFFSATEHMTTWCNKSYSIMTCYYGGTFGKFDSDSVDEVSRLIAREIPAIQRLYPSVSFPAGLEPELLKDDFHEDHTGPVGLSWEHEEFSRGSYSSWGTGTFEIFDAKMAFGKESVRNAFRPIENRIFFAGEHTALDDPATLEGAVESGERTARIVERLLISFAKNKYIF